jgi:hypothetical protein
MPCVRFEPTVPASERAKTVQCLKPLGYRDRHRSNYVELNENLQSLMSYLWVTEHILGIQTPVEIISWVISSALLEKKLCVVIIGNTSNEVDVANVEHRLSRPEEPCKQTHRLWTGTNNVMPGQRSLGGREIERNFVCYVTENSLLKYL